MLRRVNQTPITKDIFTKIVSILQGNRLPDINEHKRLSRRFNGFSIEDNEVKSADGRILIHKGRINEVLAELIKDPKQSQLSRDGLYNKVTDKYLGITKTATFDFVKRQEAYQLMKEPKTRTISRKKRSGVVNQPIRVFSPNKHWQADTVNLSKMAGPNNGVKRLLTVVDCYSKFAWVEGLKNASAKSVKDAFERIFNRLPANIRLPSVIQTDNGTEFAISAFLKDKGIEHVKSRPYAPTSNGIVERFNKTIKTQIFKQLALRNDNRKSTQKYINMLQDLVWNYNDSKHSATGRKPSELLVMTSKKQIRAIATRVNGKNRARITRIKSGGLSLGDSVRLLKEKPQFHPGYVKRWSDEVYVIEEIQQATRNRNERFLIANDGVKRLVFANQIQKITNKSIHEKGKHFKAGQRALNERKAVNKASSVASRVRTNTRQRRG